MVSLSMPEIQAQTRNELALTENTLFTRVKSKAKNLSSYTMFAYTRSLLMNILISLSSYTWIDNLLISNCLLRLQFRIRVRLSVTFGVRIKVTVS